MDATNGDKSSVTTDATFLQLVAMFQMAALQQMGKLVNPLTNEAERDLALARSSIDVLETIRRKTAGNLSEEENGFLDKVIFELQMNFVDESKKPTENAEDTPDGVDSVGASGADGAPDGSEASGAGDTKSEKGASEDGTIDPP